jgi:hypothetical protein
VGISLHLLSRAGRKEELAQQCRRISRQVMADILMTHETSPAASVTHGSNEVPIKSSGQGWRFWVILVALGITSLGAAVESTVISTALPRIAEALDAKELYVWFANAYTLTRLVFNSNLLPVPNLRLITYQYQYRIFATPWSNGRHLWSSLDNNRRCGCLCTRQWY